MRSPAGGGPTDFKPEAYAQGRLTAADVAEMKEAFDLFDGGSTGVIDAGDLREALGSLGVEGAALNHIITALGPQDSGINFARFVELMTSRGEEAESRDELRSVFRLFDAGDSGFVTLADLRRVARELGETIEEVELQEMIERADSDGDRRVSFEDFCGIMNKKSFN